MTEEERKHEAEAKQTGAKITTTLYLQLRAQALLQGRTVGELIDDAIRLYLGQHEGKPRRTKFPAGGTTKKERP